MFELTDNPIEIAAFEANCRDPRAGAWTTFEGRVRNHHEGRDVLRLEYEAYRALAESEGASVVNEALERFEILHAACVHRLGALEIGETSVWVGVSAAHRDAAFEACRYIIDQVKARVPIWKKEYYTDGDAAWVNCACGAHSSAGRHSHSASV